MSLFYNKLNIQLNNKNRDQASPIEKVMKKIWHHRSGNTDF